ncbi:hypothetical protein DNTS_010863 [Danionella cerebrum]|uniref:Uncharacterized protein n=1 Tax=Danionella cerebrum TaxID=2873325 RepID=A0A553Q4N0_9TELE|nr:hypothetical protein DNTS_010863 [Danionella translucida]
MGGSTRGSVWKPEFTSVRSSIYLLKSREEAEPFEWFWIHNKDSQKS